MSESKADHMVLCRTNTLPTSTKVKRKQKLWDKIEMWPVYRCFHLRKKKLLRLYLQDPFQKKNSAVPMVFPHLKQKDLRVLVLYLHAKAKAYPTRFESIVYSVQSQGLL